ncbi:MAG: flavodoxin [Candidatus Kapabacteria bacterium]|nr:flavodoxin [Ignavibacteriota bacterium]MCW5885228.1 flavodoxin [Candidatus Kapabacteria bacterium]
MQVGLFYGTNTGNTETVAQMLAEELKSSGFEVDVLDMASAAVDDMSGFDNIIIACPTWNDGELQDDWDAVFAEFERFDFSGKKVAFLGLGDQDGYPDNFLDALGTLAKPVLKNGGTIVGYWSTDGYDFSESTAIGENGKFYGLGIDQDNQEDLTEERIKTWVAQLKSEF